MNLARWALTIGVICCLASDNALLHAAEGWRAGAAKRVITPNEPMWMAGYGGRTGPSSGKLSELHAKALLLEDAEKNRGLILSLDLVGIDRELSQRISTEIADKTDVPVENIVICTSHTHSGPVVGKNLGPLHYYQLSPPYQRQIDAYAEELLANCVEVASAASGALVDCQVFWGTGQADFATNRRSNAEARVRTLRAAGSLAGPVDHDVPVLAVRNAEDKLIAVLFGYACHATVLSGNQWSADYPGYAQTILEERHPDCVALFFAGCGADQNPLPRRTVELAEHYGSRLATAVDSILLTTEMKTALPRLECRYGEVALPLGPLPTTDELAKQENSTNKFEAARARLLLGQIEKGKPLSSTYPYPVSVWRIGDELKWVALGGEVVVDYSLRTKFDLRGPVFVAGYSHDVMAYIPSRRVLAEGGYEGGGAMVYYGLPSAWAPEVEEVLMGQVVKLAKELDLEEAAR